MIKIIQHPWPWWIAGPLIGLTVPALLFLGNKPFGISSSLRHVCAACVAANIPYFRYDWKKEIWNLFFVTGILIGGFLATYFLADPSPVQVSPALKNELAGYHVTNYKSIVPVDLFSFSSLLTLRGFVLIVVGGFLVGFGTRYAGGCTSGHSIMGISNLQMPSIIATCCFMIGGFITANWVLPFILQL